MPSAMTEKPLQRSEVLNIAEYEKTRPEFRQAMIALKERRRVPVGPHFTFLFENHATVRYQVQEMMRVERIVDEQAIRHEIDTYNQLVPREGGLSATLLLEYDDAPMRSVVLPQLLGIDKHVWLEMGALGRIAAQFDNQQIGEDRVSSVQYLHFTLPPECREQWKDAAMAGKIKLAVDHPHYHYDTVLSAEAAAALGEDLA